MENIAKAVVTAQSKLHNLGKNAQGHNYQYLTLDKLIDETRGILAECGLAIVQPMAAIGETPAVKTILIHESGEMIEGVYPIAKAGMRQCNDAQQMGAAVTYARRYGLAAMLNIAQADDDGACIPSQQTQLEEQARDLWEVKKNSVPQDKANEVFTNIKKDPTRVIDYLRKL